MEKYCIQRQLGYYMCKNNVRYLLVACSLSLFDACVAMQIPQADDQITIIANDNQRVVFPRSLANQSPALKNALVGRTLESATKEIACSLGNAREVGYIKHIMVALQQNKSDSVNTIIEFVLNNENCESIVKVNDIINCWQLSEQLFRFDLSPKLLAHVMCSDIYKELPNSGSFRVVGIDANNNMVTINSHSVGIMDEHGKHSKQMAFKDADYVNLRSFYPNSAFLYM